MKRRYREMLRSEYIQIYFTGDGPSCGKIFRLTQTINQLEAETNKSVKIENIMKGGECFVRRSNSSSRMYNADSVFESFKTAHRQVVLPGRYEDPSDPVVLDDAPHGGHPLPLPDIGGVSKDNRSTIKYQISRSSGFCTL